MKLENLKGSKIAMNNGLVTAVNKVLAVDGGKVKMLNDSGFVFYMREETLERALANGEAEVM